MTNKEMTEKEITQACLALVVWFESQDLKPTEAVPIMVKAIVYILAHIARDHEAAKEGDEIVGRMIMETLRESASVRSLPVAAALIKVQQSFSFIAHRSAAPASVSDHNPNSPT